MAIFAKLYKKDINLTPFMVVFHVYNFPHNNQIEVRAEKCLSRISRLLVLC